MALQCIILLLISVFFSKALTLRCYECMPDPTSGSCTDSVNTCPSQCSSMTMTVYTSDIKHSQSMKICGDSLSCINGSINTDISQVTLNTQCCNTDLCNIQMPPELPRRAPNGKICYTCDKADCKKPLDCEGDETQCITTTVDVNGKKETLKGCSSKSFCGSNGSRALGRSVGVDIKCCAGNLCNSAQTIRVFLMPLIALISLLFL